MVEEQNQLLKILDKEYFKKKQKFQEKYHKVHLIQKCFDKNYQTMKNELERVRYKYFFQKETSEILTQIYFHIIDIDAIYQMIFDSISNDDRLLTKTAYINFQMTYNIFYANVYNLKFKIGLENSLIRSKETLKNIQDSADELFNEENYIVVNDKEINCFWNNDFKEFLGLEDILKKAILESWHYEKYQQVYLAYKKYQKQQQLLDEKKSLLELKQTHSIDNQFRLKLGRKTD